MFFICIFNFSTSVAVVKCLVILFYILFFFLQPGDNPSRYGHQRFWGSVGWGLFVIITGVLVDEFSGGKPQKDYTVAFYLMLVMLILDMLVSSRIQVRKCSVIAAVLLPSHLSQAMVCRRASNELIVTIGMSVYPSSYFEVTIQNQHFLEEIFVTFPPWIITQHFDNRLYHEIAISFSVSVISKYLFPPFVIRGCN